MKTHWILLTIILLSIVDISRADTAEPNSIVPVTAFPGGWKRIPFTIQGKPRVTRTINVHYPIIGGLGKDSYSLKGTMGFDGKKIKVSFVDDEPCSLFIYSEDYYLVSRHFFARSDFVFSKYDEKLQRFIKCDPFLCPQGVFDLKLDDEYSDRAFKLWCLKTIYKNKGFDESFAQFEKLVKENPGYLLSPANYKDKEVSLKLGSYFPFYDDGPIDIYIKDLKTSKNVNMEEKLYDYLHNILNSAAPMARGSEINGILFCMYKLSPEKATVALREYILKIERDKNIQDDRLTYLLNLLKYIEEEKKNKTKAITEDPNQ